MFTKVLVALWAVIALLGASGSSAQSSQAGESWQPSRTITITAPSNPGGGWDTTARFLQLAINENALATRSVEVVNRGGGGGTIGLAELATRSVGDPHELMVTGFGMTGSILMLESRYSLDSTTPLVRLTDEYQAIGVPADSPIKSLEDLVSAFEASPSTFAWGGGSAGGSDQVFMALFAEKLGIDPAITNYVAFTGGGEAAAALLGGQVDAGISGFSEWGDLAQTGRVRLLAVSAPDRRVDPDLPTFHDLGYDLDFSNWRGIVAPPGISDREREALIDLMTRAHASDTWQDFLHKNGLQDSFQTGEEFSRFIASNTSQTARILEALGVGSGTRVEPMIGAFFFPILIAALLLLTAIYLGVQSFKMRQAGGGNSMTEQPGNEDEPDPPFTAFAISVGILLGYLMLARFAGFVIATPFFIAVMARQIGSRSPVRDIIVAVLLTAAITFVFQEFLDVELL